MAISVSVIIPTYNYAQFIETAIQSVLCQNGQDLEILVVDSGSDNTREIVKRFGKQVHYIYQQKRGLSLARNTGIKAARGNFIAFLDADDYWLDGKLDKQLQLFNRDSELGLVYSLFYAFESESGAVIGYKPIQECCRGYALKGMFNGCMIGSPTLLIKREVFDDVGLYREDLKGAEDYEMWLRIAARFKIDFVPEPLAMYRVHQSAGANLYELEKSVELLTQIVTECYNRHRNILTEQDYQRRLYGIYESAFRRAYLSGEKKLALRCLALAQKCVPRWDLYLWWLLIKWSAQSGAYL